MGTFRLVRRSLFYYWRTHLAVVAAVATTVAVLAGALLVGDSVRASLRNLSLARLGNTAYVVASQNFFGEAWVRELEASSRFQEEFGDAAPLIVLPGVVTHERSRRRASSVQVYGVDERFWRFHGEKEVPLKGEEREVLLSAALAREFEAVAGDTVLVRVEKPSVIPLESLHGRKDDIGRTLRLSVKGILPPARLGEFSLRAHQGSVRAVFVLLKRLQRNLRQEDRVNTVLVSQPGSTPAAQSRELEEILGEVLTLEDAGVRIRILERQRALSLESDRILIEDYVAETTRVAAKDLGMPVTSIFTYLANTIRIGNKEIPYSLATALAPTPVSNLDAPQQGEGGEAAQSGLTPIWLNQWAFNDLAARTGEEVTLEYYLWEEDGRLETRSAQFELQGSLAMEGIGGDSQLAPQYPGITDSESVADWDPPFPIDLGRIRARDEEYWDRYRTAPKAFIPLGRGQELWGSRFGQLTALRFRPRVGSTLAESRQVLREHLRETLDPMRAGFAVVPVRARNVEASRGAVNFGEYFLYFSFFLVVSALLLTSLFFRLNVEQRFRQVGLLQALGFERGRIGRLLYLEALVLAVAGSLVGLVGAVAYGWLIMHGLRTWWVGAVGTNLLELHLTPAALAVGVAGGIVSAPLCVLWTMRGLRGISSRSLLSEQRESAAAARTGGKRPMILGVAAALLGLGLLLAALLERIGQVAGFFGSGTLVLIALVCFQWVWLTRRRGRLLSGGGFRALSRMGFRNATWRPGRSLVCITLLASATFIIVAVDAFRRGGSEASQDRKSGTGGYPLLAESLLPFAYNPNSPQGRENLFFSTQESATLEEVQFVSFRVRPGEDTSCLNLYQPHNPKIVGASPEFVASGRFSFRDSLAEKREEKNNPWRLLNRVFEDGALPVIADANSMAYVLHVGLGDDLVVNADGGDPVRLRFVAALSDSIFQDVLIVSEGSFLRAFPRRQGYRFFLLDVPASETGEVTEILEERLSDYGFDVVATGDRLATFHQVENTYLSTFQALGGLGLLLGTVGLAAILLRNVLERRREMALLRAVGYRPGNLAFLVVAENALLLAGGLFSGILSAVLAIAPALSARGGGLPVVSLGGLLLAVLLTGFLASVMAVTAVVRAPLLAALRAE